MGGTFPPGGDAAGHGANFGGFSVHFAGWLALNDAKFTLSLQISARIIDFRTKGAGARIHKDRLGQRSFGKVRLWRFSEIAPSASQESDRKFVKHTDTSEEEDDRRN